jgi:hypothetical protein
LLCPHRNPASFLPFLAKLGLSLGGLMLPKQVLFHLNHAPSLFVIFLFQVRHDVFYNTSCGFSVNFYVNVAESWNVCCSLSCQRCQDPLMSLFLFSLLQLDLPKDSVAFFSATTHYYYTWAV